MASSDAIVVVEDWISEHYFTTDATSESFQARVLQRRKVWDADEHTSTRDRFLAVRNQLGLDLAALYDTADDDQTGAKPRTAGHLIAEHAARTAAVVDQLLGVLGYRANLGPSPWQVESDGPVHRFISPGLSDAESLVVVAARPIETVEDVFAREEPTVDPVTVDEQEFTSVARLVTALFGGESAPSHILVLAGRWLVIAEQARWAEGRCLGIDIQTIAERNDVRRGGEIDKALTCLEATSLAPDADGSIWWDQVREESVKHTVGVSKDLREGVRTSIELIANDVVRRRAAQNLPALTANEAQPLAVEALRYLYRILFLLYAEASPELEVLPVGAPEFQQGYSVDRLRELVLVELTSPRARNGTHLHHSLATLFSLVQRGHHPTATSGDDDEPNDAHDQGGLTFNALRADLFEAKATRHIDEVSLSNESLQLVLRKLLLSKESRGRDRGFISYVELGINQLGAVYEGLMSYTGSFAAEDLYEVAPGGNAEKGSWVVAVDQIDDLSEADLVKETNDNGEPVPVVHRRGEFVYRLSGRERQQSASFYTPEVLTRFTVGQALEELIDPDGTTTPAVDILNMTVCEPALGSGAFAIEAVRQLAERYLARREQELGETVDPEERPKVLQRVKAHIALHQVHGVDLNRTAVELAEVSLWLDTMSAGLQAPWFGLRLRRGNSLIGARHAVYRQDELADKRWLTSPATVVPLTHLVAAANADIPTVQGIDGRIHHFLLPAQGWGATAEAKEAKELATDKAKALRTWSRSMRGKIAKPHLTRLLALAERVETLWQYAWRRLTIAGQQAQRDIDVWGYQAAQTHTGRGVSRDQIEASLADPAGAYRRLKLVMDAWCALWFWPLTDEAVAGPDGEPVAPPNLEKWISTLEAILGKPVKSPGRGKYAPGTGQGVLNTDDWETLGEAEALDLSFAGAQSPARFMTENSWLTVAQRVADRQGFFHWELEFAPVFGAGGFDLQVGNPPWVRPRTDVDALLAETDPWWMLANKPSEEVRTAQRERTLAKPGAGDIVVDGVTEIAASAEFMGHMTNYPVLAGLQPDTYRCFMAKTWSNLSPVGVVSLVHPESHFTDERAGALRAQTYARLRRHWQFVNELHLYEVHNLITYGINVYGQPRQGVGFLNASSLYHPETLTRSLAHNGDGPAPGLKDDHGNWDQRPHAQRITRVDTEALRVWRDVLEDPAVAPERTRMLYTVNTAVADVLTKLAEAPRLGSLGLNFSAGWHEKMDRTKGRFTQKWGAPDSWEDVILQGPHLFVNNPAYKVPNETMNSNKDWSELDLETLAPDAIPVTSYKPAGDPADYDAAYTHWDGEPARDSYRIAWRRMAANTGARTLISGIVPKGTAHVHPVHSAAPIAAEHLITLQCVLGSLLSDFMVRSAPKNDIQFRTVASIPMPETGHALWAALHLRTLRLNCVTDTYADLWQDTWDDAYRNDSWALDHTTTPLADISSTWSAATPLRRAIDRRQAQVEIDAFVAVMLGVTAEELCTVYRTQFAVLRGYDQKTYFYDANGRLVPNAVLSVWRKKGDALSEAERTHTNAAGNEYTYELPFRTYDREDDMRTAHAAFTARLADIEGTEFRNAESPQTSESGGAR